MVVPVKAEYASGFLEGWSGGVHVRGRVPDMPQLAPSLPLHQFCGDEKQLQAQKKVTFPEGPKIKKKTRFQARLKFSSEPPTAALPKGPNHTKNTTDSKSLWQ